VAEAEEPRGVTLDPSVAWVYRGPGWREWLMGLGATAMGAGTLAAERAMDNLQSAAAYYGENSFVAPLHGASLVWHGLMLLSVLGWMGTRRDQPFLTFLRVGAGLVIVNVWVELVLAAQSAVQADYLMTRLPIEPINSGGLWGAAACGVYLILRLPAGRLGRIWSLGLKLMLAAASVALQFMLWQGLRSVVGLP